MNFFKGGRQRLYQGRYGDDLLPFGQSRLLVDVYYLQLVAVRKCPWHIFLRLSTARVDLADVPAM